MKKIFFLCIIVLSIVVILGGIAMLFSAKKSYEPKTKQGEFPFSLTYKVNGETTTIKNTYVCVFEGVGWDTGRGFYRKWNGYVKETGLENVLIFEDSKIKVFCQVGDPQFYMGDDKNLSWENKSLSPPHIYLIKKSNNYDYMSVEEIKQTYGIEIISWEFSEPIKGNTG